MLGLTHSRQHCNVLKDDEHLGYWVTTQYAKKMLIFITVIFYFISYFMVSDDASLRVWNLFYKINT